MTRVLHLLVLVWALTVATGAQARELVDLIDDSVRFMSRYVPFQVDPATRLTAVTRDRRALVYHYQVERTSTDRLDAHGRVLSRRTCANRALLDVLQLGGSVRYTYRVRGTDRTVVHEFAEGACRDAGVAI